MSHLESSTPIVRCEVDFTKRTEYHEGLEAIRAAHKLLAEATFTPSLPDKGYTNRTLYVNVGTREIMEKPVTRQMKDIFLGGRGFGLWYLWNAVTPATRWNDPENEIIIGPGPVSGTTQYAGSGKSLVVTLSPQTDIPVDSNVGGYFGPLLKFSGFDALELQGKADQDVILFIDGRKGVIRIEAAPMEPVDSHVLAEVLTRMYAENDEDRVNISVVSTGAGAEHSLIGMLNFSWWDPRRGCVRLKQAGRGGIGTVFRDKRIRALVCRGPVVKGGLNNPVDPETIAKTGIKFHKEMRTNDDSQCKMRRNGTAHIVEIMDAYDLLPTHNFQYGSHPDTHKIASPVWQARCTQETVDGCWYGCSMACAKGADGLVLKTGPYKGHMVTVDGPEYENAAGLGSNGGVFDPDYLLELNFYCDTYGVCTITWGTLTAFVMECYQRGILNLERTGGLDLTWGNAEADLEMMHQMARGEGFGLIAGQGIHKMKAIFAEKGWGDPQLMADIGMECKGLEYSQYMSKESLAQQGGYALTNKGPQHDEAWLIFMDMVNKQLPTFEDKAEALYYFPLFRTWFGLNGFCKLPWNDVVPSDNATTSEPAKVPEHVQNYVDVFNATTGLKIDKDELIRQSAKVYNFQRIFNIRMGKGLRSFDIPPYRSVGPVTREEYASRSERYDKQMLEEIGVDPAGKSMDEKIAITREYRMKRYNSLVDAVYLRRGWTPNGVPTLARIQELGLDVFPEVVEIVKNHGG
ncbi:aldehyde ferredoxin oxidoreductase family protein [Mesoterricola silvestris]|uniref:Aldehyde ferredoxin oxidoreductase n=1 Tax=Mesoterricola silvestris TaxID=2927979 RepID=A0AA48GMW8_9BACT|nr:aldehyde ferredoxin oxidoreductase C-terminal domain-containing protein [Mesoterricola silvestris]BDU70935.1 aldehyde ferredoxin oxidoreductase [Mesoterricola silvestris]